MTFNEFGVLITVCFLVIFLICSLSYVYFKGQKNKKRIEARLRKAEVTEDHNKDFSDFWDSDEVIDRHVVTR